MVFDVVDLSFDPINVIVFQNNETLPFGRAMIDSLLRIRPSLAGKLGTILPNH